MAQILVSAPLPMSSRLERLNLFPGRHLGEDEFDRLQDYADARLEPLLGRVQPGIVRGLEVRLGQPQALAATALPAESLVVTPGLAVSGSGQALGLFGPIRHTWRELIDQYLADSGASSAAGVFYLTLRRNTGRVDTADSVDPCQRGELDPSRDTRRVVVGELALRRLNIDPQTLAGSSRDRVENWAAAAGADGGLLRGMHTAIPLGLVAVDAADGDHTLRWFSEAAGRYLAQPDSGYRVLLRQVTDSFLRAQAAVAAPAETRSLVEYLDQVSRLDFMPAAGPLPLDLLQDRASLTPQLGWWPAHVGVDVVPVPEESLADLVERHLARRVIDLRAPAGDRIRLLLAVNEPDYRRDLLDLPQIDRQLEADLYTYYRVAHDAWRGWKRQFDRLYHLAAAPDLSAEQIEVLDLPTPLTPPRTPEDHIRELVAAADAELRAPGESGTPYPYAAYSGNQPADWARPQSYLDWLVPATGGGEPRAPLDPPPPGNGLAVEYALAEVEIERLENEQRALRKRLEATRDYLLLQRQQLDVQTVSLASLAGGVAGDGSGLQLARWLPFTRFTADGLNPDVLGTDAGAASVGIQHLGVPAARKQPAVTAGSQAINLLFQSQPAAAESAVQQILTAKGARIAEGFQASNVDYRAKKDQLDLASSAPAQTVSEPGYNLASEQKFGVIGRVLPDAREYRQTFQNLVALDRVVDELFPGEAAGLRDRMRRIGQPKAPNNVSNSTSRYQQMFKAGKLLIEKINLFEARHNQLELALRDLDRELRLARARLQKLGQEVITARRVLEGSNNRRLEELGDYGVATRLLEDDWRGVHARFLERARVLNEGLRGLYYVRVRPTPVTASLADPLALRYAGASDLVPGCDGDEDAEVPDELAEFFDAVLEVPIGDWRALEPLLDRLPAPPRIEYLFELRRSRLGKRRAGGAARNPALAQRLQPILSQNQAILSQLGDRALPVLNGSVRKYFAEAADRLSLADVINGSHGKLRRQAGELREKLEQCVVCSLRQLNALAPSLRLQWAQLAEDDRLAVDQVQRWPGLELAEREAFNTVRTLAELIDWWFRQLGDKASASSRGAARNLVRGLLILASLGDPAEILHGQVQVPPRRLRAGEALRIKLNRRARPGTKLQLLDTDQRLVASLDLVDEDDQGAIARVVKVDRSQAAVTSAFTVVSSRKRGFQLAR